MWIQAVEMSWVAVHALGEPEEFSHPGEGQSRATTPALHEEPVELVWAFDKDAARVRCDWLMDGWMGMRQPLQGATK